MKKVRPNYTLYLLMIACFVLLRFLPLFEKQLRLAAAIDDLAVGGLASTIVALLIDVSQCVRKRVEIKNFKFSTYQMVYISILTNQQLFANTLVTCFKVTDYSLQEHTWNEWLDIFKLEIGQLEAPHQSSIYNFMIEKCVSSFKLTLIEIDRILSSKHILQTNHIISDNDYFNLLELKGIYDTSLILFESSIDQKDNSQILFSVNEDIINWINNNPDISNFKAVSFRPWGLYNVVSLNSCFSVDFLKFKPE